MADLVDIDLDALAPAPKRVKLAGKVYRLPGDLPLGLFLRIQAFEQRLAAGQDEAALLGELGDELLGLFQVYQPTLKALPEIGVLGLLGSIGAIYGAGTAGEPPAANRATRRQKKRTPSRPTPARRPATSR